MQPSASACPCGSRFCVACVYVLPSSRVDLSGFISGLLHICVCGRALNRIGSDALDTARMHMCIALGNTEESLLLNDDSLLIHVLPL